jgi:ferric-dicitrate binding protein FerR (iron transport regulator)
MELPKMPDKLFTKKLQNTTDHLEELKFNNMMSDENKFRAFQSLIKIWKEAEKVKVFENIDTSADWEKVSGRINERFPVKYRIIPWRTYFLRIAALMLLTGGLSVGFYKLLLIGKSDNTGFTIIAADQQKKDYVLPDGSLITLNKGSEINFREGFGKISREVILNGTAFFNVVPNSDLPFKVFSGNSVIEVTGTRFSVYELDGKIHVSVLSGRVLLASSENLQKKVSITANHSGYIVAPEEISVEEGVPVNALSWKTGHLVFDRTPIDSALHDIAHHFGRNLTFETSLTDKITAEFQDQPLHEILDELELVAGLQFDTTGIALIVRK